MKKITNSPFFSLIIRDLKVRYVGSYLGIMWAFIQPAVTLFILWIVFSVGFKARPGSGVGFMEWLIPGYLAWQYIAESVSGATISIVENNYLVKKIKFDVEKLPLVKIMSALIVHIILVLVMLVVEGERTPLWWQLQIVYYMLAASCLSFGLGLFTSAVTTFARDLAHFVSLLLQLGFWGTPIFWNEDMMPTEYKWIVRMNPASYIVEGYRQSILGGEWFWERPETLSFWLVSSAIFFIGLRVFTRMRPHFADVL